MPKKAWYIIGGVGGAIVAWWLLPNWIAVLIIAAVIAAPVVGYFMLDPSQRKRLHRVRRKQIGG
ncbi:MAG: hypothetical protein GEV10_01560 [Streptosporangiales bacterium]|nr:hypothetical protein [Streptosporangiales bacterium]